MKIIIFDGYVNGCVIQNLIARQTKIGLIVILVYAVSACSLKTIYNRLYYLIPSYVEGMVTLDDVLEEKVKQHSLVLINWHRNTQLIQYADWLRALQHDLGPELSEERLLQHFEIMATFWHSLSMQINEEMVALLPFLNAEQREELFESIAEKNDDFRDEFVDLDEDERIASYTEFMLENYENWLGNLTDRQKREIEKASGELRSSAGLRLEQRLKWQRSIQAILDSSNPAAQKSEGLRTFFAGFDMNDHADMKAINLANKQILAQLTMQIAHGLTAEQKQYFISKTNDYIQIFTELANNR